MCQPPAQCQTGTGSPHPLLLPHPELELPVKPHGNSEWGTDQVKKSSCVLGRFPWIDFCSRSGKVCYLKNADRQRRVLRPHTEGDEVPSSAVLTPLTLAE